MSVWPDRTQKIVLVDVTADGSLQPFMNEAVYYWNQAGAMQFDTTVYWHPGESVFFDGLTVRVGKGPLTNGYVGETWISNSQAGIYGAYVLIDDAEINRLGWGENQYRCCVTHELGHVLGLPHDDASIMVMNTYLATSLYGDPVPADITDLKNLYGV